jgi:hypothetical protein
MDKHNKYHSLLPKESPTSWVDDRRNEKTWHHKKKIQKRCSFHRIGILYIPHEKLDACSLY